MEIGIVKPVDIVEEMRTAYLEYAMSVIVSRALPDVRDGLKPVQRRILYGMWDMGIRHDQSYKKSARIVGEVLGRTHPHGDSAVYDALVRLAQEWNMRYPLVDGQGNFGCFTGDTKIKLRDGTEKSFKELAQLPPDEIFYVYSVDKHGRIVVGEGRHSRITRRNAQLIELTLDNGERIRCTPDHRFMLRDGTYKEAQDLTPEDSLMPGYFDTSPIKEGLNDYLRILQPATGEYEFVHHMADSLNAERGLARSIKGPFVRHHQNFNRWDNRVVSKRVLNEHEDVYDITVDIHHNFLLASGVFVHNSIDADAAAAMRYTEARLSRIAEELLFDIDKNTVDFKPNFDGSYMEPSVLPARLPNLLLNGAAGIAVGMATNIPPHNLNELCQAIGLLIDNPEATVEELMEVLPGPDFPTGGIILGREGIINAYSTGKGHITIRAKAHIEEAARGAYHIIVTELPYQVNKAKLIERIAELVKDRRIEGIRDVRDESDRSGIRVVIMLKQDAQPKKVLNQLFKYSQMQVTFGVNMLALVDGMQPRVLTLKKTLQEYINHRQVVIRRRTEFELGKARDRAHILEGLKIALDHLDEVIQLIRNSRTTETARTNLMKTFRLSERQANAILEMQLRRLAALERKKIEDEYREIIKLIAELEDILANPRKVLHLIKSDLQHLQEKYGDARRTRIVADASGEISTEDLIPDIQVLVTLTDRGYIKRCPADTYRVQRRGGRGIKGLTTREDDVVTHLLTCNTMDDLLFFTNRGKVYQLKAHEVPDASRTAKGLPLVNLVSLEPGEQVTSMISVPDFEDGEYLVMATVQGRIKRTALQEYSMVRSNGLIAISLVEGDELRWVRVGHGNEDILMTTALGQTIRFRQSEVRPMGRDTQGVIGIRLDANDTVIGMELEEADADLLVLTANGMGKRTALSEYPTKGRGTGGVVTIKLKPGDRVAAARVVKPEDQLTVITRAGIVMRTRASGIPRYGRATQGVGVMNLTKGDAIAAVAVDRVDEDQEPQNVPSAEESASGVTLTA